MDYKEKLQEAKRLYETATADQKYVLESLFPELKESEDEKIRKALISVLKSDFEKDTTVHDISVGDIIAWLEKQGEQKPTWGEDDEKMLNSIIEDFGDGKTSNMLQEYWLKSLRPQTTWKPSDEQMADLWNMLCECRPANHQLLQDIYYGLKKLREE